MLLKQIFHRRLSLLCRTIIASKESVNNLLKETSQDMAGRSKIKIGWMSRGHAGGVAITPSEITMENRELWQSQIGYGSVKLLETMLSHNNEVWLF